MPHGQCYLWQTDLLVLHAVADSLIALSYLAIPLVILYFIRKRQDVPFRPVFLMFGAFIVACGTTHLIEVWTIWQPVYWLSGWVKAFTAVISIATAFALVRIVPAVLSLPSQADLHRVNAALEERVRLRTADLTAANERLRNEADQREQAETDVRRLNAALEERVGELHTLFDLMPVGIAIADDAECHHVRYNRALANILNTPLPAEGYPFAVTPQTAAQFKVYHDGHECRPEELALRRAAATNTPVLNSEKTVIFPDGRKIEVLASAVPLRDAAGNVRGCISIVLDVTDRKVAENERIEFERRLLDTQKLEGLGVLAGGIAHDFNNLLTGILGNASLARMDLAPSQTGIHSALNHVEQASHRAADLCKQLLAYAGKGRFVIKPLDLSRLVSETAQLLEISISKKVPLQLHLASELPSFEGDATQIRQVLMNLVINGAEAIGDRSGSVTVQTGEIHASDEYLQRMAFSEKLPAGRYVTLEVADTGGGMAPSTLTKIFDPFFTTKFTGRGLGLAAVQGIVRGHKGGIKVYSEVGRGTTFKILLPADKTQTTADTGPKLTPEAWRGSGHILVVDDEETVRTVAETILLKAGFTVTLARDGVEAMELFQQNPESYRAVLLDLTMPRMDGAETLRALHTLKPGLTVILTSGFNEQATIQSLVGRGLAGFVPKPFSSEMLLEKIRAALEKPAT
jgi:signal transduction histidine kinase/ActR/RegA family two-component response regulator